MRKTGDKAETRLTNSLDDMALYQELMPVIREVAKSGGGADAILRKSEAVAAIHLVQSLSSHKADVSLKAAIEVLNRVGGRPVERSLNIFGDLSKLNERDIDNQIMRAIQKSGAQHLIGAATQPSQAVKK